MNREQFIAQMAELGFTHKVWEYNGCLTFEHPLCQEFYLDIRTDEPIPTMFQVMDKFYHDARRDESNDHRCF